MRSEGGLNKLMEPGRTDSKRRQSVTSTQRSHAVLLSSVEKDPATHEVQLALPGRSLNWPGPQGTQLSRAAAPLEGIRKPRGQGTGSIVPKGQ